MAVVARRARRQTPAPLPPSGEFGNASEAASSDFEADVVEGGRNAQMGDDEYDNALG